MNYDRIVIIAKNQPSNWKSCQSIVGNLLSVYQKLFSNITIHHFPVPSEYNAYQAFKTAEKIKSINPQLVIWIDHSPNPTALLKALEVEFAEINYTNRPKLLIHVFGDFVIDCLDWAGVQNELSHWPLHFLTASSKQKVLLERFFESSESIVSELPFPVDEEVFNTKNLSRNRNELRESLNISKEEKIFLYTGRVSYQKNIEQLLKTFSSVNELNEGKNSLWIAGGVDDILLPYFGKYGMLGSYCTHLNQVLSVADSKIKFWGNCSTDELVKLYHASDVFVSMSTYNDEDYGMSPAEALCTGLPSLLSNWGGYTSFSDYSSAVTLLPVAFGSVRPVVDSGKLRKLMMAESLKPVATTEERKLWSEEILKQISIQTVSDKLKKDLSEIVFAPLESFSQLYLQMCDRFKNNKYAPFKNESGEDGLSQLYKDVYSAYSD